MTVRLALAPFLPLGLLALTAACGSTPVTDEPVDTVVQALTDGGGATCTSVTLTASPASPQALGSLPILTAKAKCGGVAADYEFQLTRPGGAHAVMQAFSSTNTWPWETSAEVGGDYTVEVTAHAKGTSGAQATAKLGFKLTGQALMAAGQAYPYSVAIDQKSLYWADYASSGAIMSAPVGGGAPTTLAAGRDYPWTLVLSGGEIFWSEYGGGNIMKISTGGGTPVTLAKGQDPYGLAVEGKTAFWTNYSSGTIVKVATGGGTPTTLASEQSGPEFIASDSKHIYWTTGQNAVMKLPHDGGTPSTLVSGLAVYDLAVDSGNLLFTSGSAGVLSVPVAGGKPATFASVSSGAEYLFLGGSSLYWTDGNDVVTAPLSGGAPATLTTTSVQAPIAADSTSVYWMYPAGGELYKVTP